LAGLGASQNAALITKDIGISQIAPVIDEVTTPL
jgi:hypothetical protein